MRTADQLLADVETALRGYQSTGKPLHTLGRPQPNWVTEVTEAGVWVETKRSRGHPQLVRREGLRASIEELLAQRTVVAEMLPGSARFRSAFVLAALSLLPGARHGASPPSVTLREC